MFMLLSRQCAGGEVTEDNMISFLVGVGRKYFIPSLAEGVDLVVELPSAKVSYV